MAEVSKEFIAFTEAQDAIRAWVRENKDQPIPQFLKDRLAETQRAYERVTPRGEG